uniref:Uncharacterized protein n=1 Tax=Ficedula albicollis TaxID=59894 RepID=A0A803VVP3_FICAL
HHTEPPMTCALAAEELPAPSLMSQHWHEELETSQLFFRELFMLQNVYHAHVDAIQGAISLPADSAAFSAPALFPGKEGGLGQDLSCGLTSTAWETSLALALAWCYLLNTCGQDLSLKNSSETIHLLEGLEGKNITPSGGAATSPHHHLHQIRAHPQPQNLIIYFGSVYVAVTCLFVLQNQHALHLLDTNSPEGHFWVMPCRIPGEHKTLESHLSDKKEKHRRIKGKYFQEASTTTVQVRGHVPGQRCYHWDTFPLSSHLKQKVNSDGHGRGVHPQAVLLSPLTSSKPNSCPHFHTIQSQHRNDLGHKQSE